MWLTADGTESSSNVNYCFINVGRAAGKVKFCMLDAVHSSIGEQYDLRAVMTSDTHSRYPVAIHVLAIPKNKPDSDDSWTDRQITTLHQLVWRLHNPKTLSRYQSLYHINGNTMDNRIENVALVPANHKPVIMTANHKLSLDYLENTTSDTSSSTLYYNCVHQLVSLTPWVNTPECFLQMCGLSPEVTRSLSSEKDTASKSTNQLSSGKRSTNDSLTEQKLANEMPAFYECHYLPCVNIEGRKDQFDSCGGCRSVRYCSTRCQGLDWAIHKPHCDIIQHLYSQSQLNTLSHLHSSQPITTESDMDVDR